MRRFLVVLHVKSNLATKHPLSRNAIHPINMDRPLSNHTSAKKRKASNDYHDRYGAISPRTPPNPRLNSDLGSMLRGSNIPPHKYRAIQAVMKDQEQIIAERGAEIKYRCTQIHNLKKDLSRAHLNMEVDSGCIKKRDSQIADLEKQLERAKSRNEHGNPWPLVNSASASSTSRPVSMIKTK